MKRETIPTVVVTMTVPCVDGADPLVFVRASEELAFEWTSRLNTSM